MIINTFSTFDLTINLNLTILIFIYLYFVILSISQHLWASPSNNNTLASEATNLSSNIVTPTNSILIIGTKSTLSPTIIIILTLNLASIIPYGPSLTAHLIIDLSLCLPLWFSIIIWSLTQHNPSIAHYLPENTINSIAPFLSLVEGVSSLIRPITLSFRLSANISAGHVIIAIIGTATSIIIITSNNLTLPLILSGAGYFAFEIAICFAQAFVLVLLSSIYTNDYHTNLPSNS